jgi:hypothetical protein
MDSDTRVKGVLKMQFVIIMMMVSFGWAACSTDQPNSPTPAKSAQDLTKKPKKKQKSGGTSEPDPEPSDTSDPSEPSTSGADFPRAKSLELFAATAHPYLKASCGGCHVPGASAPVPFAQDNVEAAHDEIINHKKVNLGDLNNSRMIQRLVADSHNCPSGDCVASGAQMTKVIKEWIEPLAIKQAADTRLKTASIKLSTAVDGPANAFQVTDFVKMANEPVGALNAAQPVVEPTPDETVVNSVRFTNANNANANCAAVTANSASRADYSVTVERAGNYNMYLRAITTTGNRNTVCVLVNDTPGVLVTLELNSGSYKWMPAQAAATAPNHVFALNAGANTVRVFGRGATNNANNATQRQVTFNRIAFTQRLNEQFRGVQTAPPPPKELVFDLKPMVGKDAKLFLSVNKFDDEKKFHGVSRLRLETQQAIKIEGVDVLVNGKRFDFNKTFRAVKFSTDAAGSFIIDRASGIVQGENAFDVDEISLSFDKVE